MKEILNQHILDNKVENFLWFIGIIFFVYLFKRYLSHILGQLLYRFFRRFTPQNEVEQFNFLLVRPVSIFLVFITVFFSFKLLRYPTDWNFYIGSTAMKTILLKVTEVVLSISFTWILLRIIDFITYVLHIKAGARRESRLDNQLIPFFKDLMKVFVVIISLFIILGAILQVNVTSLLAGLGIGGLAIALAAQESLANLFGSFTIFLDRPFSVGDQVKVGTVQGTVESVGFRSTRIRTLDKTFVTVPNKMMVNSFVDNLTLRTYIRVNMTVGLSYDTTPEQLRSIINELQQYFDSRQDMKGDNFIRFNEFGKNAFVLAIEYLIVRHDDIIFQKAKEEVNFKIMETVQKHGAKFAQLKISETKEMSE